MSLTARVDGWLHRSSFVVTGVLLLIGAVGYAFHRNWVVALILVLGAVWCLQFQRMLATSFRLGWLAASSECDRQMAAHDIPVETQLKIGLKVMAASRPYHLYGRDVAAVARRLSELPADAPLEDVLAVLGEFERRPS